MELAIINGTYRENNNNLIINNNNNKTLFVASRKIFQLTLHSDKL